MLKSKNETLQEEVKKALNIHNANSNLQKQVDKLTREKNVLEKENEFMQSKMTEQNDTIRILQDNVQQFEIENQHQSEIRMLEKQRDEVRKTTSELSGKVCQNCLSNYQKLEDKERELKDANYKIEQLEKLQSSRTNLES